MGSVICRTSAIKGSKREESNVPQDYDENVKSIRFRIKLKAFIYYCLHHHHRFCATRCYICWCPSAAACGKVVHTNPFQANLELSPLSLVVPLCGVQKRRRAHSVQAKNGRVYENRNLNFGKAVGTER